MTQYHGVSVKLSNLNLLQIKAPTKISTNLMLRFLSNLAGTKKTNFPDSFLLIGRQVSSLPKVFENN